MYYSRLCGKTEHLTSVVKTRSILSAMTDSFREAGKLTFSISLALNPASATRQVIFLYYSKSFGKTEHLTSVVKMRSMLSAMPDSARALVTSPNASSIADTMPAHV